MLLIAGFLFHRTERLCLDRSAQIQRQVTPDQKLTLVFNAATAAELLAPVMGNEPRADAPNGYTLIVLYSCGGFHAATKVLRSGDALAKPLEISRDSCLPDNAVLAFFANPLANLDAARHKPLVIDKALVSPVPDRRTGLFIALSLLLFMGFFAIGPGVCVWLALSELMPTRIRSSGMSIALLLNQSVSTAIAALFLPVVGRYGYSRVFWGFACCAMIYFLTVTLFLPETKGKTLEEIEGLFTKKK
jgi:hypothetical protein